MSDVQKKLSIRFVKPPSSIKPRLLKAMVTTYAKGFISKNIEDGLEKLGKENETLVFFISCLSEREFSKLKTALNNLKKNKAKVIFATTAEAEHHHPTEDINIDGSITLSLSQLERSTLIGATQLLLRSISTSTPIRVERIHSWKAPTAELQMTSQDKMNASNYNKFITNFKQQYLIPVHITDQCSQLAVLFKICCAKFSSDKSICQVTTVRTDSLTFSATWKFQAKKSNIDKMINDLIIKTKLLASSDILICRNSEDEFEVILIASQQLTQNQIQTEKKSVCQVQVLSIPALQQNTEARNEDLTDETHSIDKAG